MIKYTVEKSANGDYYVLWKNIESKNAYCSTSKFIGTKRECYRELKRRKIEEER